MVKRPFRSEIRVEMKGSEEEEEDLLLLFQFIIYTPHFVLLPSTNLSAIREVSFPLTWFIIIKFGIVVA